MAQQDPTLMNATPSKKALLDSLNTQVKAQTSNQYGYSPYQAVGSLPAQEQDAILGDMANQITYKGNISVTKDDLKQLPAFRPPTFLDSLGNIGKDIGQGILAPYEEPNALQAYGNRFLQNLTGGIIDTPDGGNQVAGLAGDLTGAGTAVGIGTGLGAITGFFIPQVGVAGGAKAGGLLAGALTGFGNTLRNYEDEGRQLNASAYGDAVLQGGLNAVPVLGKAGSLAGKLAPKLAGRLATSGVGKLAKTSAGSFVGNALLEGGENVIGEAGSQAFRNEYDPRALAFAGALGAGSSGGLQIGLKGIEKLAGKRAKITKAPSQKEAVEALQNEVKNAPLASQRNRARVALGRMNTEYLKQPLQTKAKPASKPFKASLEAPQAVKKPVGIVPIKTKIKPPLKTPDPIVGGLKKKVTPAKPAEVAKPAKVEVPKEEITNPPTTKESSTVEPKPQETAVEAPTEVKLKAKVKKDTKGFASELKGAVKNGKISEDEAKNILYNLDEETKQQIVDEIGCHCHE